MSWLTETSSAISMDGGIASSHVVAAEPQSYSKVKFSWVYNGKQLTDFFYLERSTKLRREGHFLHLLRNSVYQGEWERIWSSTEFDVSQWASVILFHFGYNLPVGACGYGRVHPEGLRCTWEVVGHTDDVPVRPAQTAR